MKTRKIIFSMILLAFSLVSCKDTLDNASNDNETDISVIADDSLTVKFSIQSNPEFILTDRIITDGSSFILDLSEKDIKELNITSELYQQYVTKVEEMNSVAKDSGLDILLRN